MIHDVPQQDRGSIMPSTQKDTVAPDSRRINQNVEIITANRLIQQTSIAGLANGTAASVNLNFTNVQNAGPVVAFWEVAVYVGSITNANLIYPRHTSCTHSPADWKMFGPTRVFVPDTPPSADDFTTPQTQDIQKLTLYNISAGTVDLFFAFRVKYTFNRG